MARKRFGINFKGFEEQLDKFQKLGGNVKPIVEKCLEAPPDLINPRLDADMAKHNRTGKTRRSIAENKKVEWSGTKGRMPVGFQYYEGGIPSIFLMYGTARHAPANQYGYYSGNSVRGVTQDKKLYNDIYGSAIQSRINAKQKEIFDKEIEKRMGGN